MRERAEVEQVELHQNQHQHDPEYSNKAIKDVAVLVSDEIHVEADQIHLEFDEKDSDLMRVQA